MLVKQLADVFKLFDTLKGIQLNVTLDSNENKNDVHYYRQSELECTLLLVVGQLMIELSRMPIHIREDNRAIIAERLKEFEFNDYTYRVIKYLLLSIDQVPFMIEGDYLTQLHHTAKQLRFTTHTLQPVEAIQQQCETITYFRTLVKQYMILNSVLFNAKGFVTAENITLLFEVLYSINNYANMDHIFYEGIPLKGFEDLSPIVQKRNDFIEFRFLSDIITGHLLKNSARPEPVGNELDSLDILQMLDIIDDEGTVNVDVGFTSPLPSQEQVTRSFIISDEMPLYMTLETVARFMDWNPKLMDTPEWAVRFDLIKAALLTCINQI